MVKKRTAISIFLALIFGAVVNLNGTLAVGYQDFEDALKGNQLIIIPGFSKVMEKNLMPIYTTPKVMGLLWQ